MNDLEKLKNSLSKKLFGMNKHKAIYQGVCISCKQPALSNCYSEAGAKEYTISGLCEKCFDGITGGN